jgi:hypothetical protein
LGECQTTSDHQLPYSCPNIHQPISSRDGFFIFTFI